MSGDNISDLEIGLKNLLSEEAPSGLVGELRWLCDQLAQYLERWLGFARMEDISVEATLKNKLFLVVNAAINVIDERLDRAKAESWCPRREWFEFKNAVAWIRQNPNRDELSLVETTFEAFSKKLKE